MNVKPFPPSYLYSSPHKNIETEWFLKACLEVKYCSNQDVWQLIKPLMNSPELKYFRINIKRINKKSSGLWICSLDIQTTVTLSFSEVIKLLKTWESVFLSFSNFLQRPHTGGKAGKPLRTILIISSGSHTSCLARSGIEILSWIYF